VTSETMTIETAPRSYMLTYSGFAFFLLVANLRPALTSVGPLLGVIRSSLNLSGAEAGLLGTLPLLLLAGMSPLARLGDVFGIERTLAGCLAMVVAGIALRSEGSIAALFVGTAIFSTGIGVANVLVPSLIKRDFPHQVGSVTTAYVMVMSLTAAAATGLSVPLSVHLSGGWRSSLAVWAAFAVLALVCWLPVTRKESAPILATQPSKATPAPTVWRSLVAWHVTIFMGVQFLIYYVTIGWMPLFLAAHGYAAADAGWLLTLYQVMAFAVGFVAPVLLRQGGDQRVLAVAASLITAGSILGLISVPSLAGLWLTVGGASFGLTFILAFALIGMRTADHRQAAALSTMSQASAYLIAATGPIAFGWLRDFSAGWMVPMTGLLAVAIIQCAVGFGAGREGQV
jgi:MFS transporter, CP family, cyanate transporter